MQTVLSFKAFRGQTRMLATAAVLVIAALLLNSPARAQDLLWNYKPPAGGVDSSIAALDTDGDGTPEIIAATTSGMVVALDAKGKERWRQELPGQACFPVTVANLSGGPEPEVLAMNTAGQVFCLRADSGAKLWDTVLPGSAKWGTTALAAADVNGDGALEIVLGLDDGTVVCLKGTGEQLWTAKTQGRGLLCPAVADVDGDGAADVLIGGEEVPLVCLAADGKEKWRLPKGTGGSPFACDLDQQGPPEILLGVDSNLTAVDGQGKVLWTCPMHKKMDSAISFADADADGELEIYAVDLSGYLACVTLKGQVRWSAEMTERVRRSPSIGDVDGDGKNEILVAGYSRALFVFDAQGRLEKKFPLSGTVNSTPTLVAWGQAGLCAVIPVWGEGVNAYRWPDSKPGSTVLWPEFRFDARRLGMLPGSADRAAVALSVDWGAMYGGTNLLRATVSNPEKRKLTVHLEVTREHGDPVSADLSSAEEQILGKLWYTVSETVPANLSFQCTVSEEGQIRAQRTRSAYLVPFAKDYADADRALRDVEACATALSDARGIEDRAAFLRGKLEALRDSVTRAGVLEEPERITLREALKKILAEAQPLRGLAQAAKAAEEAGAPVRICAANPWAPFGGIDELLEGRTGAQELNLKTFLGETESGALNLFNLSSAPRTFYVEVDPLTKDGATVISKDAVSLFEAVEVCTELQRRSTDALPRLNSANQIVVPAWSARQLWLNVDTRALSAGPWSSRVRLRSLDLAPVDLSCPLQVTVWNAALPKTQTLRQCGWGYVESSLLKDYPEAALEDQIQHGTNVFVCTTAPKAQFDAAGNLVGACDFADHDAYVKRYASHGIILYCGYQGALQGPAPVDSEVYAKAHVAWLRAWVKHLTELGVGYDNYALYPVDEPGLAAGLVDQFLRMAKLAREADPKVQLYTDPVERITMDDLRAMKPYVDIWCPNRSGLVINPDNTEKLAFILQTGKPVWMYECFANAKHQSPLAYYRAQSWLAWQHGITGIGFWTYCTSPDNPWFVAPARSEYMLVYPGNGVVSSKRWEATRDGMEDYNLLALLRDAAAAQASTARPEDLDAAKRFLGQQAGTIGGLCSAKTDEIDFGDDGFPGVRRLEDQRWATVQAAREELARLLAIFVR